MVLLAVHTPSSYCTPFRVIFSAARDGSLPDALSGLHVKQKTPVAAVMFLVLQYIVDTFLCCYVLPLVADNCCHSVCS